MRLVVDGAGVVHWAIGPRHVAHLPAGGGAWVVQTHATAVQAVAALASGALWLGVDAARWPDGTTRALALPHPVRALACDGDATRLLVAGDDAVVALAGGDDWRPRRLGPGAAALAHSGDGHTTYVGRGAQVLTVDDHHRPLAQLDLAAPVRALALSPAGLLAVVAEPGAPSAILVGLGVRHGTCTTLATMPGAVTAVAYDRRRRCVWLERDGVLLTVAPQDGAAAIEVAWGDVLLAGAP